MDLQKFGAYTGIAGAILVALNFPLSKIGFVLFFLSSVSLSIYYFKKGLKPSMQMQMVFIGINTLGIIRWF